MKIVYEIFIGHDDQYYFHLTAGNSKIILKGSEGYVTKQGAENGIESVRENSQLDERFQRFTAVNGNPEFRLVARNGKTIGVGEDYSSEEMMEKGIKSVKENAPIATIVDSTIKHHEDDTNVTITIKGKPYRICKGAQSVTDIKRLGDIPVGHILLLIEGTKITRLPEDKKVIIRGGEVFDSTPPNGSNS
jgi:uncharacterized protein YegP (UPF0339 family)